MRCVCMSPYYLMMHAHAKFEGALEPQMCHTRIAGEPWKSALCPAHVCRSLYVYTTICGARNFYYYAATGSRDAGCQSPWWWHHTQYHGPWYHTGHSMQCKGTLHISDTVCSPCLNSSFLQARTRVSLAMSTLSLVKLRDTFLLPVDRQT
jgi:hypothetical protein